MARTKRTRIAFGVVLVLVLPLQVACAARGDSLDARVARVERMLEAQGSLQIGNRLEMLQREVRELRGMVEEQARRLDQLERGQPGGYVPGLQGEAGEPAWSEGAPEAPPGPADRRLPITGEPAYPSSPAPVGEAEPPPPWEPPPAESAYPPVTTLPSPPPEPAPLPAPETGGGDDEAAYQAAFEFLRRGSYTEAKQAFRGFLTNFPRSPRAGEAHYWLGEANYVTRDFAPALEEFNLVVSEFPQSPKVPDALLKIGYVRYEMGDRDQARAVFTEVSSRYPGSGAARLAQQRLERMRAERP